MEELDKIDWKHFRENHINKITKEQFELICQLHAKYYKHSYYKPCTCRPHTIKTWIAQLNNKYAEDNGN
jgi:hypothetical protein